MNSAVPGIIHKTSTKVTNENSHLLRAQEIPAKQGVVQDFGSDYYVARPKVRRGENPIDYRERLGLPPDPEEQRQHQIKLEKHKHEHAKRHCQHDKMTENEKRLQAEIQKQTDIEEQMR